MEEKLISIIIPMYNAKKYIERCLNSVINQTYSNLEIILIDDGSNDGTDKICDEYSKMDARIRVIHKKNEGVSKARNQGIDIITGNYVLFVDSDDWLETKMCEVMINQAEKNNDDIVFCEYNYYYENTDKLEHIKLKDCPDREFQDLITDDFSNYGGFPWNKLIKRSFINEKFNEKVHYYENLLFFIENSKIISKKINYSVIHSALYNYCINDTSAVHSKKYSIKKLSTVEALKLLIPMIPERNKDYYKMIFITSYYNNYYFMKKLKMDITLLKEYESLKNSFYKDIMNSTSIGKKIKLKVFILVKLYFLYYVYQTIKK